MRVKTSELTGIALRWMVAECEGTTVVKLKESDSLFYGGGFNKFAPDTDWNQGGPIIDREFIAVFSVETRPFEGEWAADIHQHQQRGYIDDMGGRGYSFYDASCRTGPTPLVAAMRCYVASKLGDEVDVPDFVGETT